MIIPSAQKLEAGGVGMNTINVYEIAGGLTKLEMPIGARILTAQAQDGIILLWAVCDTYTAPHRMETRTFSMVDTWAIREDDFGIYIATVQQTPFSWHIFEKTDVAIEHKRTELELAESAMNEILVRRGIIQKPMVQP